MLVTKAERPSSYSKTARPRRSSPQRSPPLCERLPNLLVDVRGDFVTIGARQPKLIAIGPLDEKSDDLVNRVFLSGMPVGVIHEDGDLDRALGAWGLA